MRIVLLGDSHLARVRRDLGRLVCAAAGCAASAKPEVVNAAVGGAFAADLVQQAAAVGLGPLDRVALSVGTNDAAPWKQVALAHVRRHVDAFLSATAVARLVYLSPPGVDETSLAATGLAARRDRTNECMDAYGRAIAERLHHAGAEIVDGRALLDSLGRAGFADDGLHLNGRAYDVVLPALASALCGAHSQLTG